jgi:hypothetical protein
MVFQIAIVLIVAMANVGCQSSVVQVQKLVDIGAITSRVRIMIATYAGRLMGTMLVAEQGQIRGVVVEYVTKITGLLSSIIMTVVVTTPPCAKAGIAQRCVVVTTLVQTVRALQ